jgi:hypothetical protein
MVGELVARHALPKEVIDGVTERAGGVPLFVEEVARLLLEPRQAGRHPSDPADAATIIAGAARPDLSELPAGIAGRAQRSRVFSSRRMILPVLVLGRSATNCTARGTL